MERSLGLMCGAGMLPARMADEARRRGWRVVAFTFGEVAGVADRVDTVVPARIAELGAVLERLAPEGIASVLFSGRFSMPDVLRVGGRAGLSVARTIARTRIGQTVVIRHGAVVAVEAVEGTTETVRRGAALGGRGAVVVKAVAPDHDYRFDAPAVGPETLAAAADGGVALIAIEANRVLLFDRAESLRLADAAGIAVVGIDETA